MGGERERENEAEREKEERMHLSEGFGCLGTFCLVLVTFLYTSEIMSVFKN